MAPSHIPYRPQSLMQGSCRPRSGSLTEAKWASPLLKVFKLFVMPSTDYLDLPYRAQKAKGWTEIPKTYPNQRRQCTLVNGQLPKPNIQKLTLPFRSWCFHETREHHWPKTNSSRVSSAQVSRPQTRILFAVTMYTFLSRKAEHNGDCTGVTCSSKQSRFVSHDIPSSRTPPRDLTNHSGHLRLRIYYDCSP